MPPTNEPAAPAPAEPATPVAATPPQSAPAVTPDKVQLPDGFELIRTEDKKAIISQRDKANSGNQQTDAVLSALMQKDAIRDARATPEFQEKYPDVTEADLIAANPEDVEEIEKVAAATQARFEKIKQAALEKVQVAGPPTITQADQSTKLGELKKPSKTSRFQEALRIKRMQVK